MNKAFILHGWTYSTEKWKPFVNLLKQKSVNSTILKIPGLTEKLDKVWKIDDYVEWLRQKIESQKFNNRVVLIGHSNGGRIGLNFAIKYPQNIAQLILIDSAGVYHDDLPIRFKRYMFESISKIGKKLSSSEKLKELLYNVIGETDYKNANPDMRQTMINLLSSDKMLNFAKINSPTLIIWGEKDKITPLKDGKLIHGLIKNSKLYIVKGAKHSPQFTNAEEVADTIFEYLKTQI